ncbi:MAG TPA: DUF1684 domain-containing protein [Anaerolineales bacterium]|nr:DUF1684 domain-containing protein [Anaerolineales bacterium]
MNTREKEHEAQILLWQAKRYDDLVRENGWLALAGLSWLKEGRNLIGSNPLCEVNLPDSAPTFLGVIEKKGRIVRFLSAEGVRVEVNGKPTGKTILKSNQDPHPSFITWNKVRMVLHEHGDRYAIRVWDNSRTERFTLPLLRWFPINKNLRFNARYTAYSEPKITGQADSFGEIVEDHLDGYLSFTFDGRKYQLDVTKTKAGKLFLKFKDLTSSRETYPPSRYLYTEPVVSGKVILDFNYAYSPPCAYTPYATCIFAPPQNHLPFRVEAGEIYRG